MARIIWATLLSGEFYRATQEARGAHAITALMLAKNSSKMAIGQSEGRDNPRNPTMLRHRGLRIGAVHLWVPALAQG